MATVQIIASTGGLLARKGGAKQLLNVLRDCEQTTVYPLNTSGTATTPALGVAGGDELAVEITIGSSDAVIIVLDSDDVVHHQYTANASTVFNRVIQAGWKYRVADPE